MGYCSCSKSVVIAPDAVNSSRETLVPTWMGREFGWNRPLADELLRTVWNESYAATCGILRLLENGNSFLRMLASGGCRSEASGEIFPDPRLLIRQQADVVDAKLHVRILGHCGSIGEQVDFQVVGLVHDGISGE